MERIRVDVEDLIVAMQTHDGDIDYYLDRKTGGFLLSLAGMCTTDETGDDEVDVDEILDAEPDRYRYVEPVASSRAFRVMEEFVEDHAPAGAKDRLWRALEGRKPFRQFKDTLETLGDVRDQWFVFEEKTYTVFAERWLEEEEIDAELFTLHAKRLES